uniref:Uncharacterized protein MANES_16G129900 n=1 Tax=Rhizophora mucronata TaxID=61149 RepID=A0A2P2JEG5_RHIMU
MLASVDGHLSRAHWGSDPWRPLLLPPRRRPPGYPQG